ncbi:MarR family winged helix-turn-helix transcriptional regulator [Aestuariibacter salexigens]|uniref:MarR family winged helix-turn-helix transcriptional regulator n=1 Tax=Aestuariibacter salexigens TaxID=226010 RepID=UPI0003FE3811|nr:MarR family transcriptional regulator [Aestuariibacter salexigens]
MANDSGPILTLERYLPYRLSILSNKVSSVIAQIYKNKFALSVTEWRIMAVLGEYPGISADEISVKTQLEKSILSRAINRLLKREFISREFAEHDKRRSMITLSETGQSVYQEIVPLSYEYEKALLNCFTREEQETLVTLLDRLYEHAEQIASSDNEQ